MYKKHDLNLPEWGPYTKRYMGISHIADDAKGIRFDLCAFPGIYRGKLCIPNVLWESDFHPFEANADLSFYTIRHEIQWKDKVYADISYLTASGNERYIRCRLVNNTDIDVNTVLHFMASIAYPFPNSVHERVFAEVPSGAIWVDGLDYTDLKYAVSRPQDNLTYDAKWRGEELVPAFTGGNALGDTFGAHNGDRVVYTVVTEAGKKIVLFRYISLNNNSLSLVLDGTSYTLEIPASPNVPGVAELPVDFVLGGNHKLEIVAKGLGEIKIDGFAIFNPGGTVNFKSVKHDYVPQITLGNSQEICLKYRDLDHMYGLKWEYPLYEVREFHHDELDSYMKFYTHSQAVRGKASAIRVYQGNQKGHFTNLFLRPFSIQPHTEIIAYAQVCCGTHDEVKTSFGKCDFAKAESLYSRYKSSSFSSPSTVSGEKYQFSQNLFASVLLTNVVYPVYIKKSFVKHNTPGRWWDSLYTWDSGFIGIGLSEIDIQRSVDNLKAYLTEPGDSQAAFVHHGSMVPVQFYQFLELFNKTQDAALAEYCYPRLKQYYDFYAGRGSSTMDSLGSHLLKPWDYFYNSGGWDDYSPQVFVHANDLRASVSPVINTAHAIRIAKILQMTSDYLGYGDDYSADISMFSQAIQKNAWDQESGYYGYVCHDEQGYPCGILRTEHGVNYNMGLDGAYPLVAGIADEEQEDRLMQFLIAPGRLWSTIGLSTVDMQAPYYQGDGYWNGSVWMPHQWFFWKTMLDIGQTDFARKIAITVLDLWKRETDESYNSFEHFVIEGARGAGWHHFGGLSSPVLSWFGAYFRSKTISAGFDVWITEKKIYEGNAEAFVKFKYYGNRQRNLCIIAVLSSEYTYKANVNGNPVPCRMVLPGAVEISIESTACMGKENILHIEGG